MCLQLNVSRFCFHNFLFLIYQLNDGLAPPLSCFSASPDQAWLGPDKQRGRCCPWDSVDLPTKAVLLQAMIKICICNSLFFEKPFAFNLTFPASYPVGALPRLLCSFGQNQTNIAMHDDALGQHWFWPFAPKPKCGPHQDGSTKILQSSNGPIDQDHIDIHSHTHYT